MKTVKIEVCERVKEFVKENKKDEALKYNNLSYLFWVYPTAQHRKQYNINRDYILNHFDK